MPKNKTFCIKPWTSSVIRTNGDIAMCCSSNEPRLYNLKNSTLSEYWNSSQLKEVREKMLNGEKVDSCQYCYMQENAGIVSPRQKANDEYKVLEQYADKILAHYQYPKSLPVELEVQLTNLCNLKCLMCNEYDSSSVATEHKILKISDVDNKEYAVQDTEIEEIKNWLNTQPRMLNLRGGEPLMVPEIKELLLWALEKNLLNNTEVHITTNATNLNQEWLEILSKIPKLRIMVSVDAVGQLGEYIRFNSHWDTVADNIKTLSKIPKINLIVHATIQNLNILHVDKLISWAQDNNYYLSIYILVTPEMFKLSNLPMPLLLVAKNRLLKLSNSTAEHLVSIIDASAEFDADLWNRFCEYIELKDSFRNVSILNVLPELKEYYAEKA